MSPDTLFRTFNRVIQGFQPTLDKSSAAAGNISLTGRAGSFLLVSLSSAAAGNIIHRQNRVVSSSVSTKYYWASLIPWATPTRLWPGVARISPLDSQLSL